MLHELQVWIGFNDKDDGSFGEGDWRWSSNGEVYYNNWGPNQPDNWNNGATDEDCAMLYTKPGRYWNDISCNTRMSFVCQF